MGLRREIHPRDISKQLSSATNEELASQTLIETARLKGEGYYILDVEYTDMVVNSAVLYTASIIYRKVGYV